MVPFSFCHSLANQNPTPSPARVSTGIAQTRGRPAAKRSGPGASPASPSSQVTSGPMTKAAPKPSSAPAACMPTIHRRGIDTLTVFSAIRFLLAALRRVEVTQHGAVQLDMWGVRWTGVELARTADGPQPVRGLGGVQVRVAGSLGDPARDQRGQALT